MRTYEQFLVELLRHQGDLKAFIGSLVRDPHARDDVFQDAVLTLWNRFGEFDSARSFGAWARGIAANKVLERRRQDARFPALLSSESIHAVAQAFDNGEDFDSDRRRALGECVASLPDHSRQILALRYEQHLPVDKIALRMGRTLDAAYQALSRIRAALAECIRRRLTGEAPVR